MKKSIEKVLKGINKELKFQGFIRKGKVSNPVFYKGKLKTVKGGKK